ncbi:MAG: right-handed parallel beta-helix repeat-containing protein [Promethearchaeota archaeon]
MLPIQSNFNQMEEITQNPCSSALTPHSPISISDETTLLAFVASESLDGSGSEDDPHVIQDYIINCGGSGNGIEIYGGLTSFVLIKNCEIRNGTNGIAVQHEPNVDVSDCTIEFMITYGITIAGSASIGNRIENCDVSNSPRGILLNEGVISNCVVHDITIYALYVNDGIIEKCIIYNTESAIQVNDECYLILRQNLFFNYTELLDLVVPSSSFILWDDNVLGIDGDGDGDGISDHDEYIIYGTDRFLIDTDMDNYHDGYEIQNGFDPLDDLSPTAEDLGISVPTDTDGDGLDDAFEVEIGTDPLVGDTDGDGFYDGIEVLSATDPLDANDYPGVGEDEPSGIPGFSFVFLALFAFMGIILIYKKNKIKK